MTLTLKDIRDAIAGVIKQGYPQYKVYGSPTQQGAKPPCFFVFFLPDSKLKGQIGRLSLREIGVDIVFYQERNTVNTFQNAEDVADYLDECMSRIPFGECFLGVHERSWEIEDELHYKFKIKERVYLPENDPELREIELYTGGVK